VSTLNLGILAHIDAGKTSLTERILYSAGVIGEIGSVDDGSTQTDSLALERQRGITIKSAVVSFAIDDVTVNLIDTPGHPDFIAEVERVLSVLDGAVLVISAVEGVQAQTRVLMRTLQRLRIPVLVFVNKIDRSGAREDELLESIAEKLTPSIVAMAGVRDIGTRAADPCPYGADQPEHVARLVDVLSESDEAFLAAYVADERTVSYARIRRVLADQTARALVHPVFFGSAITGAGVEAVMAGIRELLPVSSGDADGPVRASVFKVERGPAGEKIAYVRMFSGTIRNRDRVRIVRPGAADDTGEETGSDADVLARVTGVATFEHGSSVVSPSVSAGHIGRLWGLGGVKIGDALGEPPASGPGEHYFAPPTLETVVDPACPADRPGLHAAMAQLAEQDPLINLRQDDTRQEIYVSLYGEVQKEVIEATIAADFGLDVTFRETTTICIERPEGIGEAYEQIGKEPNPFLAGVGLRIEPAPVGSGVEFLLGIELGSLPLAFLTAIRETVTTTLREGLSGWQVTDCTVTLTKSGYYPRQSHSHGTFDASMSSTAGDFRNLTPLVLMTALTQAGTGVYEPMHRFELEFPADLFGAVVSALTRLGAIPATPELRGASFVLDGDIPAARVHDLEQQLPGLTRGEGELLSSFDHYRLVHGVPPTRSRTDRNPLDRKQYLLRVAGRI
jgi:ribosomal protection tetracycline resistance protein